MALDTHQKILIEQRVTNDSKSAAIAYLLLIFLGFFGAHRFYLGKTKSASLMVALNLVGWMTLAAGIGLILLVAVAIWAFIDLFLIPKLIRQDQEKIRSRLAVEMNVGSDVGVSS